MNELKPCPFCGNEHMFYEQLDRYNWSIKCGNCSCRLAHFESKDLAADGWNTRADDMSLDKWKAKAMTYNREKTDLLRRVKEAVEEMKDELIGDEGNVAKQIVYKHVPELEE
jgi:Lar family restriction alleviation protein